MHMTTRNLWSPSVTENKIGNQSLSMQNVLNIKFPSSTSTCDVIIISPSLWFLLSFLSSLSSLSLMLGEREEFKVPFLLKYILHPLFIPSHLPWHQRQIKNRGKQDTRREREREREKERNTDGIMKQRGMTKRIPFPDDDTEKRSVWLKKTDGEWETIWGHTQTQRDHQLYHTACIESIDNIIIISRVKNYASFTLYSHHKKQTTITTLTQTVYLD